MLSYSLVIRNTRRPTQLLPGIYQQQVVNSYLYLVFDAYHDERYIPVIHGRYGELLL